MACDGPFCFLESEEVDDWFMGQLSDEERL